MVVRGGVVLGSVGRILSLGLGDGRLVGSVSGRRWGCPRNVLFV